jgi:hypothetical protein
MNRILCLVIAKAAPGAGPGLGVTHGTAVAEPAPVIEEDSPLFDCRTMGNRICGAGNVQGVAPGFYGDDPAEPVR